MSTLSQLRQGAAQVLGNIEDGWNNLWSRAKHAVTRFTPGKQQREQAANTSEWPAAAPGWSVLSAEVKDSGDDIIVRVEVPGMEADDFDIQVVDDYLIVRGEKQWQRDDKKGRYHITECAYGQFERAIPLPKGVDDAHAKAVYRRGVLTVTLPVSEYYRSRRITINQ
ncbi:MAG TPA: Hsp20/alpha crystallin family protein [Gammaproteobacteria bacterium]|nr:Hsp20/alpha crystallin family protein [Gammaproteobacteria bacterium]